MKKIWVTSLDKDQEAVGGLLATANRYGLAADGHFWVDDLAKMAWQAAQESLGDPAVSLWVILGSEAKPPSVGFGLTLLALSVAGQRGGGPAILWLDPAGGMTAEHLPTPLAGAAILPLAEPSLGAKLVARANAPLAKSQLPYRLAVHANFGYGVWLEVGPTREPWAGAMLGVAGGEISFQGVGPAGSLPQKTVLEYPVQGLQLQLGGKEYTAWAVQNQIDGEHSYYVKLQGAPEQLLFGPYAADDDAEVFVLKGTIGP